MSDCNQVFSFPPMCRNDARILILGSMPGVASLKHQQYYAHPRNALWPILLRLFDENIGMDYSDRCNVLIEQRIALWDVLRGCQREGSLDSNIKKDSMIINNFTGFFNSHPHINRVFFNGTTAASLFTKYVEPGLPEHFKRLTYTRLPSTSPANAALSFDEKLTYWQCLVKPQDD